jgi:hypothetical protein
MAPKLRRPGGKKKAGKPLLPAGIAQGAIATCVVAALIYVGMEALAWQRARNVLESPNRCKICKAMVGTVISTMGTMYSAEVAKGVKPRRIRLKPRDVLAESCSTESYQTFLEPGDVPEVFGFPFEIDGATPNSSFVAEAVTACTYWMEVDKEPRSKRTVREKVLSELGYSRKQNMVQEMMKATCFETQICSETDQQADEAETEARMESMQKAEAWVEEMSDAWAAKKKAAKDKAMGDAAARAAEELEEMVQETI